MIGALAVPTSEALMLELDWPAPYLPARIQTVSPGLILPPAPESAVARSHGLAIVPLPLALPEVVTYQLLPLETGGGLPALGAAATETLTLTVLEPAEPAFTVTAPEYVPAASAPVETATASVPALEPDAGETLSQLWLSVSPASGSNAGTLAVAVSTGALAAGTYSGAVTVNAGSAGSKTVSVSVSVAAAPSAGNPPPVSSGNSWYVTTSGSASGNGTMASPWDLATALSGAGGRIKPGDTVWIRAGKYGAGQSNSSISA